MRDHLGRVVAHTRIGVGQGDPWGGLLFELGYQAALLHLSQHVQDEATAYNRENPNSPLLKSGHVVAYEDDTQVMGPTPLMFRIAPSISPLLAEHGFYVNIEKSYINGDLTDALPDQPDHFQINLIARLLYTVFYNCFKQCHHQSFSAEFLYPAFRDSCTYLILSLEYF